ncbi:MAG TPA: mononuclear molybdenum enzyme YedY, partial [Gammaproteobacteria bacterium]|nr:mononuclear molybdenum enzyme YedY [Gammaproteobacteria bacterium]
MLIRKPDRILGSEITPETVYYNRRQFMAASSAGLASLALP